MSSIFYKAIVTFLVACLLAVVASVTVFICAITYQAISYTPSQHIEQRGNTK